MCFTSRLIQDSLVNESRYQLAFSPVYITGNSHGEAMRFRTFFFAVSFGSNKKIFDRYKLKSSSSFGSFVFCKSPFHIQ